MDDVLSGDRSSIHVRTVGGYEGSFVVVVCRGCLDPPCVSVCPIEGAIRRREKGGGVLIDRTICNSEDCHHECVDACPKN
ncbi:MAG: hypothetical protein JSW11_11180 [Candidatus Heimdallarchaeota archaeon]|nr:MAG: hypothetical protein JSW11_11180 [Candidatus Heimdallarchaeota archaeon]